MTTPQQSPRNSLIDAAFRDLQSAVRALDMYRDTTYNSRDPLPFTLASDAEGKVRDAMEDLRRLMPDGVSP